MRTGCPNILAGSATLGLLAAILLVSSSASAQVTPVGGHHPTLGAGAGLNPGASPTGGYQASVPLDFPEARGDVPIPLSVAYTGSPRAGAAGAGFDVPISFVRRSRDLRGRKPSIQGDLPPERLFLALGAPMLMVPSDQAGEYVPFAAGTNYFLREVSGGWVARDVAGRQYFFSDLFSEYDGFWLLTEIRAAGGKDKVLIDYAADDLLPPNLVGRFTNEYGVPRTWGDAVRLRIQGQGAVFRNRYPNGSPITGSAQ